MSRTVVITGATGGLGSGVVPAFLAAGDRVIGLDTRPQADDWLARLGQPESLRYRRLNVLDAGEIAAFAQQEQSAGIDVLINLVGGFSMSSLSATSPAELERMLELNLKSTFLMCQGLLPLLQASAAGRIVNVGARQALLGGPQATAYALSKAAVVNFTQSLAAELKTSSVTVNAVVPSIIDTPANRRDMPDADFDAWVQPADLAAVIAFLASPAARAVSGAVIPVYHKS